MLFVGLFLFLIGTVICLVAQSIEVLVFGRVIQALGGGAGLVLGRTIVRDLFDREQTASRLAYVNMGMVVAPMLAPLVGGYLDEWLGWRSIFALILALGALVTAGAWRILHETMKPMGGEAISFASSFASFAHLLRMPVFRGYAFQGAFSVGTFFAFVGGAPYVMMELLGQSASDYGRYFIGVAAMFIVGNFIAGKLSPKVGINLMITLGTLTTLLAGASFSLVLLFQWLSPLTLFLPMMGVGLGNGMSAPNSLAGVVSVDTSRAGAAAGLSGCLQMMVGAAMSYMIGLFIVDSAWPMAIAMTLGGSLALAFHLTAQRGVASGT
jgi:DHA1 family bicyclomycin/chloramphenicol resistance-like MFS transporter